MVLKLGLLYYERNMLNRSENEILRKIFRFRRNEKEK